MLEDLETRPGVNGRCRTCKDRMTDVDRFHRGSLGRIFPPSGIPMSMAPYFENGFVKYGFEVLVVLLVLGLGTLKKRKIAQERASEKVLARKEA